MKTRLVQLYSRRSMRQNGLAEVYKRHLLCHHHLLNLLLLCAIVFLFWCLINIGLFGIQKFGQKHIYRFRMIICAWIKKARLRKAYGVAAFAGLYFNGAGDAQP